MAEETWGVAERVSQKLKLPGIYSNGKHINFVAVSLFLLQGLRNISSRKRLEKKRFLSFSTQIQRSCLAQILFSHNFIHETELSSSDPAAYAK